MLCAAGCYGITLLWCGRCRSRFKWLRGSRWRLLDSPRCTALALKPVSWSEVWIFFTLELSPLRDIEQGWAYLSTPILAPVRWVLPSEWEGTLPHPQAKQNAAQTVDEAKTQMWSLVRPWRTTSTWLPGCYGPPSGVSRGKKQCTTNTIYNGDGVLLISTRDVLGGKMEYFQDLLNPNFQSGSRLWEVWVLALQFLVLRSLRWLKSSLEKLNVKSIGGLEHCLWWCRLCAGLEQTSEPKGKALVLPVGPRSNPHLWSWTLRSNWKYEIMDTSCWNEFPPQCVWALP